MWKKLNPTSEKHTGEVQKSLEKENSLEQQQLEEAPPDVCPSLLMFSDVPKKSSFYTVWKPVFIAVLREVDYFPASMINCLS